MTTHEAEWMIGGEEESLLAAHEKLGDRLKDGDLIHFDTGEVYRTRYLGSTPRLVKDELDEQANVEFRQMADRIRNLVELRYDVDDATYGALSENWADRETNEDRRRALAGYLSFRLGECCYLMSVLAKAEGSRLVDAD